MTDKDGNLVDRTSGRKKFDRRQLIKNDELPNLLNYRAKRYDIKDVIGDFDREAKSGRVLMRKNGKGDFSDKQGRRVNRKGYLIDP